jgi:hypothetical protein
MDEVNKLIGQRNTMLVWTAITFSMWQGGQLLDEIVGLGGWDNEVTNLVIPFVVLIGALGWVVSMLMMLNYASKLGQSRKQAVIQDEAFNVDQAKALRLGYMTLIATVSVLMAADLMIHFSASIAIRILLIVGISVPLLAFASLNHADVEEAA